MSEELTSQPQELNKEDLEKAILSLQLERMLEEEAKRQENIRRQMEIRRMSLEALRQAEAQRLAFQEACEHLKQNGESALAGQRDGMGRVILLCQICGKIMDNPTVPPHLRIPAEAIGGPDYNI